MKKVCGTCKYYLNRRGEFRCDNEYSEYYYDVREYNDTCYECEVNEEKE